MSNDSHRENPDARDSEVTLSSKGDGHIALLRAYFGFQAYGGLVVAVQLPFARLLPPGLVTIHGDPWVVLLLFVVNTWAAFRTRRLLRERSGDGAWMAGVMFACDLVAAGSAGHIGFGAILSGVGVLLAGNCTGRLGAPNRRFV